MNLIEFNPYPQGEFDVRQSELPPPTTGVFDTPLVYLSMNAKWSGFIDGVISRLLWRDVWKGTDAEKDSAIYEVTKLLASWNETVASMAEMRVQGDILQYRADPLSEWTDLYNLVTLQGEPGAPGEPGAQGIQGIQGAQGIQGIQGVQGIQGEKGDAGYGVNPPDPPIEDSDIDNLCGIARYLVDWNTNMIEDNILQLLDLGGDSASVLANLVGLAKVELLAAVGMINAILSLGTTAYRAALTTVVLEDAQCRLYCRLKTAGVYSYDVITAWANEVYANSGTNIALQHWVSFFYANGGYVYTQLEVDQRAFIGSVQPSAECEALCTECVEDDGLWCVERLGTAGIANLTSPVAMWFTTLTGGSLSGDYAVATDPGGSPAARWLAVRLDFGSVVNVTNLYFEFETQNASPPSGYSAAALGIGWNGAMQASSSLTVNESGSRSWTGSINVSSATFYLTSWGNGTSRITKIRANGTGTNPLGADNCT
jgi:hypothetical protein